MYTVVGDPRNRTLRVMWMLEELGQTYALELAAPQSDRMRAVNVTGKAPTLLVDGAEVNDSVAILAFLADRHDALTHPAGSVARGRQDACVQFVVDEMEGACWTAAKHRFMLPEDKRAEVEPACRHEWDMAMDRLARKLGAGPFLTGEILTVADLLAAHTLGWGMKMFKWPVPEGPLTDYLARVTGRPAMAAAVARGKAEVAAAAA